MSVRVPFSIAALVSLRSLRNIIAYTHHRKMKPGRFADDHGV